MNTGTQTATAIMFPIDHLGCWRTAGTIKRLMPTRSMIVEKHSQISQTATKVFENLSKVAGLDTFGTSAQTFLPKPLEGISRCSLCYSCPRMPQSWSLWCDHKRR